MKSRFLLSMLVLALAVSGCNLPSNVPTPTPTLSLITPSATQAPFTETPTFTPVPSNTPPPTTTSTPTVPVAFPREQPVNCRLGPSTGWIQLSALNVGASAQIVGKSSDGGWWNVVDPLNSSRRCWVASSVTNTAGNLAGIPVAGGPSASVTKVSIDVEPDTINAAACPGAGDPIEFSGTIETNGPTTVTWHFETEQTGALPTDTIGFDAFGTEDFSTYYTPMLGEGTYWVRLIVTSPNAMQAEAEYEIDCP